MIGRVSYLAALVMIATSGAAQAQHVDEQHAAPFTTFKVMADRFEARFPDQGDAGDGGYLWDVQAWWGGDINKLWIETEGEGADGDLESVDLQVLYSRALTPFFDLQAGVRRDFEPDGKTYAVLGLQGLAPQWFEIDAHAYLSDDGDVTASFEAEYDLLLTQRLVLQPRFEVGAAMQDVADRNLASGFTDIEAGLRLRYEVRREFAPYVGVAWGKALGGSADLARAVGDDVEATSFVIGARFWF